MKEKFIDTIKKNKLLKKGDRIVLAVSGGADSMCMLRLFCEIRCDWDLTLNVVHLNHGFRGEESDSDAKYVEKKCKEWGVGLHSFYLDIQSMAKSENLGFEDVARRERYRLFFEVMKKTNSQKIAVAQNKNDQAETFLLHLIRGSGLEGLTGIKYVRQDDVIRPILDLSREEIELYCKQNGIIPCVDSTNTDTKYTRNKIRHDILGSMKSINPSVIDNIVKTMSVLTEENKIIDDIVEYGYRNSSSFKDGIVIFDIDNFNDNSKAVKRRLLRKAIEKVRGNLKDINFNEIEEIIELANARKTNTKKIYKSLISEVSYGKLLIYTKISKSIKNYELDIVEMNIDEFKNYKLKKGEIAIDRDSVDGNLYIGYRELGDKFQPIGMNGTKKLKDFFIDNKVPVSKRDYIPIVKDDSGIVWVVGYRQSDRCKIRNHTLNVFILRCL